MPAKTNIPPDVLEALRRQAESLKKLKNPLDFDLNNPAVRKLTEDISKAGAVLRQLSNPPKPQAKVISPAAAELSATAAPPTVKRTRKHKTHKKPQGDRLNEARRVFPKGYPLTLTWAELLRIIHDYYDKKGWRTKPVLSTLRRHRLKD
jgi:hypothetical protein